MSSGPYELPRPELDVTLPPRPFLPPTTTKLAPGVVYSPQSALGPAFNVGVTSAGVGLFVSAIKNSLEPHNKGALGVFTRTGWIVGYFGESGARNYLVGQPFGPFACLMELEPTPRRFRVFVDLLRGRKPHFALPAATD